MSQQQVRITHSLANIIRVLQTERRTGELQVSRGNTPYTETGSIAFVNGQVVAARLGQYQGPQAFAILSTWSQCFFIFHTSTTPLRQSLPGPDTGPIRTQSAPLTSGIHPLPERNSGIHPLPERMSEVPSGPLLSLTAIPSATMSVVKAVGIIEKNGLPRTYRQLIFLIDGRRSVEALIVALGLEPGEVSQMLQTLQRLQIIRLAR
ncbi:DUF4388 domain-containing protein [Dictyobacter aurantiacus]|uniref:PatA-like N-terminal domain-containing protein n=1 Tax=Dictyobacter aurantiacus TaxID=1936993 RepID=A0A401ZH55_9CHLR|nr:DUF4388 domain-containing protein [Dictyobacter aurantiacus]GCE06018.1 hypothetical protein KDAU_33470 [Dictyobacter aurantiacus]